MSTHTMHDRNGNVLGRIETLYDGRQRIHTRSGTPLGYFDPKSNKTFKINGSVVGTGNLLTTLLK